ncbi:MAG: response regulator, partial [Ruminococcus sp.]|nr:response regulator [Ruminococcus sp.]
MADIKVMIVDDAQFFLQLLSNTVNSMKGFTVCCTAEEARSAAANIMKYKPDLIILDGHMPGIEGPHFLRRIIPQYPVPIIACTSDKRTARDMLAAGAADFVPKPEQGDLESFRSNLSHSMQNAMNLREINCMGTVYKLRRSDASKPRDNRLILIGGSAGSTEVLPHILRGLTADCPPVAVTLHLPEGYTELYVMRLNDDNGCK